MYIVAGGFVMNFNHLQYFLTIARTQNYQVAAKELYTSQPTLSRAIANLESEIGVPLFQKTGRNIHITPYGTAFLEYVDNAISTINQGVVLVQNMADVIGGELNIASIFGFSYNQLPELISLFHNDFPKIRFVIQTGSSRGVAEIVNEGKADIGFFCGTNNLEEFPHLNYTQIGYSKLVLIVSTEHRLASQKECTMSDIENDPVACFTPSAGSYPYIKNLFLGTISKFDPQYTVNDDQSILNLVAKNMAVACIIKESVLNPPAHVTYLRVRDEYPKLVPIYMVSKKQAKEPVSLTTFKDFVAQFYKDVVLPL